MTISLWSQQIPGLQLIWDSSSLRPLMECPEKYRLSIREGWRGTSVDTEFGGLYASALEYGWLERAKGKTFEECQFVAVKWALQNSYGWGGDYHTVWRCTMATKEGPRKYKNEKGNNAKCPYSLKGKWFPGIGPDTCGKCGGLSQSTRRYYPDDAVKNRQTLVRAVAWYWEEMIERAANGNAIDLVKLPDGYPPVELQFVLPIGYITSGNEEFMICGKMDGVKSVSAQNYVTDNKTTKKALDAAYFAGYSPDIQVDLYDLAASIMLPELNLQGVLIEATQTLAENTRFGNRPIVRTEELRKEFHDELGYWFKQAEAFAKSGVYPKNRASCRMCQFKKVCSRPAEYRQQILEASFEKRYWNPLKDMETNDGALDKANGEGRAEATSCGEAAEQGRVREREEA
jgi:hypothetical protein